MTVKRGISLTIFLVFATVVVAGCGSKNTVGEPVDPPGAFSQSGSDTVPNRWWRTFGDTDLNRLVDTAIESNFNLKAAWSRLRQARAVATGEASSLYPTVDGTAGGEVSRTDSGQVFTSSNEELSLGLTAEYEVDLWGRIQSSVQAERYRARASRADYRTAAISLSAEITRTWYELLEQHQQLDLLQQQIETNRKIYRLIRSRFGLGQSGSADLLRQEQLLESTREQKITVESRIQVLEHQLSVLLGKTPQGDFSYRSDTLPEIPPLPETGLPADLVRRRPDVRSAFLQLKAADRELAAAISNQYPRLSFTASVSTFDDDSTDLFKDWARSFAGNLTAPLIDAGQRDAEVTRSRAARNQRLYEYGQAILTAFEDVENALVRERKQAERIRNIRNQLQLSNETVTRLRSQYFNGSGDYIEVLNALNEKQQLQRDLLAARRELLNDRVSLFRALAGGFSTGREASNDTKTDDS